MYFDFTNNNFAIKIIIINLQRFIFCKFVLLIIIRTQLIEIQN